MFINSTQATLALIIDLFNAISDALLSRSAFEMPTPVGPDLNIGALLMYALFWLVMVWLIIKSAFRVVRVVVLVGLAPIAGALLMDRATSPRFYSWLNRLFDLLIEQVALAATMIVAVALVSPLRGGVGEAFTGYVLGLLTLLVTVLGSEKLTGMAQSVTQGMPLATRLQNYLWRRSGVVPRAEKAAMWTVKQVASAAGDSFMRLGVDRRFDRTAREVVRPGADAASGHSAAAPRTVDGRMPFQMPTADSRSRRRYDRLKVQMVAGDQPDRARRDIAAIHARGMRAQADEIRKRIDFGTPQQEVLAKRQVAADLERAPISTKRLPRDGCVRVHRRGMPGNAGGAGMLRVMPCLKRRLSTGSNAKMHLLRSSTTNASCAVPLPNNAPQSWRASRNGRRVWQN